MLYIYMDISSSFRNSSYKSHLQFGSVQRTILGWVWFSLTLVIQPYWKVAPLDETRTLGNIPRIQHLAKVWCADVPSCSSSNASSIEGLYGCFGSCLPPMLTFWSVNLADHGGPWAHSSKWTRFFHDFSGMPGRSWKDLITVKLHCRPEEAIPPRATAESMGITMEPLGCGGGHYQHLCVFAHRFAEFANLYSM
jgi:hypothetical protein